MIRQILSRLDTRLPNWDGGTVAVTARRWKHGTGRPVRKDAVHRRWALAGAALAVVRDYFWPRSCNRRVDRGGRRTYHRHLWLPGRGSRVSTSGARLRRRPVPRLTTGTSRSSGGAPPPFGPEAVGWTPSGGGAYGVETYFPRATRCGHPPDRGLGAGRAGPGCARVDYPPNAGDIDYIGVIEDLVNTRPAGTRSMPVHWQLRLVPVHRRGKSSSTVIKSQTIEQLHELPTAETAWRVVRDVHRAVTATGSMSTGSQVGSSVDGWNVYDFDGYRSPSRTLRSRARARPVRPLRPLAEQDLVPRPAQPRWQVAGVAVRRQAERSLACGRAWHRRRIVRVHRPGDGELAGSMLPTLTRRTPSTATVDDLYVPAFPSIGFRAAAKHRPHRASRWCSPVRSSRRQRLSYTVLRSVPVRGRWGAFQSLGTRKTDGRGHFRFAVRSPTPGWARIDILTKSENDLTSTITRRAVTYQVLKPKKKPQPISR